jgi:hypothetical protein
MLKERILLLIAIALFMLLLFLAPSFLPAKVEKAIPVLENSSVRAEEKMMKSSKEKKKVRSVEWKGHIYRDLETHYYLFSTTKKGTIDVSWGSNTNGSDFIITDKNWGMMYYNGDVLPPGDYMFVVTSNPAESSDDSSYLTYHFTIRGLSFQEVPNTTLPQLTIESPIDIVINLPGGDQTITFKGSSDTSSLFFGTTGIEGESTEPLISPFEKTVVFNEYSPTYHFYRVSATNESGNTVNRYFEVWYDGGKKE